jgi:hypothetical protein
MAEENKLMVIAREAIILNQGRLIISLLPVYRIALPKAFETFSLRTPFVFHT